MGGGEQSSGGARPWTPGPYHVAPSMSRIAVKSANGVVATMAITETSNRRDEGFANARLIAAAPELFEALAEAVDCGLIPKSSARDGGANAHLRQVRAADMVRAALRKALVHD